MSTRNNAVVLVREPEVPLPSRFKGSKTCSAKHFRNALDTIFVLQPASFPSDPVKVIYIAAFFEGPALSWYLRLVDDGNPSLQSVSEFWDLFLARFKSTVTETDAEVNLLRIRQRNGERISEFNARFMDLSNKVPYEERSLRGIYLHSLNRAILTEFDRVLTPPTHLDEVMQLCELLESRQRRLEYLFPDPITISRSTNHVRRSNNATTVSIPRETSGTTKLTTPESNQVTQRHNSGNRSTPRRDHLSDSERQNRLENNLCLYCGESGHHIGNCPTRPSAAPKN